jgi:hypothetical protein
MKSVTRLTTIPENSVISNGFEKIDYFDTYRVVKTTNASAEEIAADIFKLPNWANWLMKIRNSIVRVFGLKTSNEARKGLFTVIDQNENEIVMGENDKHLNFRTSVLVDRTNSFIYLITLVRFNNFWGRLYFLPVKPFHKLIVKSIMKRL